MLKDDLLNDLKHLKLSAQTVRDLAFYRFIDQHRNLVLVGTPGIGKSYIAQAVGYEAARRGLDVVVFKTHKLLKRLVPDRFSSKRSQLFLKRCIDAGLLILDDFALRLYCQQEAEFLYTPSDERLSEGSVVITSNRLPDGWFSVFPDATVGGAIMDRLVSDALKLIVISGRSFREEGVLKLQTSELAA